MMSIKKWDFVIKILCLFDFFQTPMGQHIHPLMDDEILKINNYFLWENVLKVVFLVELKALGPQKN